MKKQPANASTTRKQPARRVITLPTAHYDAITLECDNIDRVCRVLEETLHAAGEQQLDAEEICSGAAVIVDGLKEHTASIRTFARALYEQDCAR